MEIKCSNCKHEDKRMYEKPCKYCGVDHSKWEAKAKEKGNSV